MRAFDWDGEQLSGQHVTGAVKACNTRHKHVNLQVSPVDGSTRQMVDNELTDLPCSSIVTLTDHRRVPERGAVRTRAASYQDRPRAGNEQRWSPPD